MFIEKLFLPPEGQGDCRKLTGNGISSITLDLPQTFNDDVDVSVYTNGLVLQGVGALAMSWSGDATATATALNAVSTIAGSMGGGADSIDVNIASEAPVIQGVGASAIVMSNNSGNDAAVASGTAANSLSSIDVSQVGYADHVGVQVGTGFVQQGVGAFAISQGPATATATALNAVSAININ